MSRVREDGVALGGCRPGIPPTSASLPWRAGGFLGEHAIKGVIRAGDDVGADHLTACGGGGGSSVDGGLDSGDITGDGGVAERAADLFHRPDEFDVRALEHCVNADDEAGEAAGFQKSYCLFGHIGMWWG